MELLFVRNVNVTGNNQQAILAAKLADNISLSAHGSYYINLNAEEADKQQQSLVRITQAAEALMRVREEAWYFIRVIIYPTQRRRPTTISKTTC